MTPITRKSRWGSSLIGVHRRASAAHSDSASPAFSSPPPSSPNRPAFTSSTSPRSPASRRRPPTAGRTERLHPRNHRLGRGHLRLRRRGANEFSSPMARCSAPMRPRRPRMLYRNDGKGHFTEVGRQAGFTRTGWAQAVCAGDIDNDGRTDLLVTYYGPNSLYRNLGSGKFADIAAKAGLPSAARDGAPGARWSTTTATAISIFSSPTTSISTSRKRPSPAAAATANGRACR